MAGGIDWFRWHHGSVTDPKFALVAKKAGVRLSDVIAVWAFVLEKASASEHRGHFDEIDVEAIDCLFGLDDGQTANILAHMTGRGLLADGEVVSWEKRQPKREREDDTAADRKRAQREREAAARNAMDDTPSATTDGHVTPCHAESHQKTPRGEESREEKSSPSLRSGERRAAPRPSDEVPAEVLVEAGFDEKAASDFIAHKRKHKAPLTSRAWVDHQREAQKAGWSVQAAAEKVMAKSWRGFEAKYVADERPPQRAAPPESFRERDLRLATERVAAFTGRRPADTREIIDMEATDVTPRALGR